jgi:PilZ domain-containing protein
MDGAVALADFPPTTRNPQPFVIPVRYVAQGEVVHATTTAVSTDDVHVRSVLSPQLGLFIGMKLYFPTPGGVISRSAVVAETTSGEFRAEFRDSSEVDRNRLSELLWCRERGNRPYPRFHTHLKAALRERGGPKCEGYVSNISRSGAFVKLESLPARGAVVELDIAFPGQPAPDFVHAYVVHVAERRGVGVQFVGASDEFRTHLDEYLARLPR